MASRFFTAGLGATASWTRRKSQSECNLPHIRPSKARSGESAVQRRDFEGEGAVGLIDFKDAEGVSWRVWQVETPAATAHLMDPGYRSGWLVFEREDGTARRRLQRVPEDWSSLSDERLSQLLEAASPVVAGRNTPTGQQLAWPRPDGDVRSDR